MRTLILTLFMLVARPSMAALSVEGLSCEFQNEPAGLDLAAPRLGWQLRSDNQREPQTA
jgi:hypothetical protein